MTDFGPIIPRQRAEAAVVACLKRWFETYLREAERQDASRQPGRLPVPRSFTRLGEIARFPESKLPAVVVAAGSTARVERGAGGRGSYGAWVQVEVAIAASASKELAARDNAGTYLAAARSLLLARQSLDGAAAGVVWNGDVDNGELLKARRRFMADGQVNFEVLLRDVARVGGGPGAPDPRGTDPATEPPDAPPFDGDVDIDIDIEPQEPQ